MQIDGALGLSLEERAHLASEARHALRLYARERCHLPGRIIAGLYDGIRHLYSFGYWSHDGMNWDEVFAKYAKEAKQTLGKECSQEDIELFVYRRIVDKACMTNEFFDRWADSGRLSVSINELGLSSIQPSVDDNEMDLIIINAKKGSLDGRPEISKTVVITDQLFKCLERYSNEVVHTIYINQMKLRVNFRAKKSRMKQRRKRLQKKIIDDESVKGGNGSNPCNISEDSMTSVTNAPVDVVEISWESDQMQYVNDQDADTSNRLQTCSLDESKSETSYRMTSPISILPFISVLGLPSVCDNAPSWWTDVIPVISRPEYLHQWSSLILNFNGLGTTFPSLL